MCIMKAVMVVGSFCSTVALFTCGCDDCDTGQPTPPDQPRGAEIEVSPLSLDFGNILPGGKSEPRNVTITNVGLDTLAVDLSIAPNGTFSQSGPASLTVEPSMSTEVEVTYRPDGEGP